jgi:hypothetical protein
MQGVELFLSLAEIAGVFVGFGALISVRAGASDAHEVAYIRPVVTLAICVVVAALAPVLVSRYGVTGHGLWLVCSLLALVLFLGLWIVNYRTPEMHEERAAASRAEIVPGVAANMLLVFPLVIALILVVLGLIPEQDPALYLTAVGLILLLDALNLLFLVFSQRRLQTASDPAALPATGGPSA